MLGGRALLQRLPAASPDLSTPALVRLSRWAPDPALRREASLLLLGRVPAQPQRQAELMRHQGWGADPLAAVALKHAALAAEALGRPGQVNRLWTQLLRRFPSTPAAADALYSLGRRRPALRATLLQRFPAHPAALAAALELGPAPVARLEGALHLARWGARWPGAEGRLRQVCSSGSATPSPVQRALLAEGLAQLGDGEAALACLGKDPGVDRAAALAALSPSGQLELAQALLRADPQYRRQALDLLVAVARRAPEPQGAKPSASMAPASMAPEDAAADGAVRLLVQQQGDGVAEALAALPTRWRATAPVAAQRVLADPQGRGGLALLRRWPGDSASWDLQWELVRRQLLAGQWAAAGSLLDALPPARLPAPLAARSRFWRGWVHRQLGNGQAALDAWRELRRPSPGGYYGWRAALLLGQASPLGSAAPPRSDSWQPLASGDSQLDQLWRLDQRTEAWELWRTRRGNRPLQQPGELLVEGRLRQGVGDDWMGLAQLEQASLRLPPDQCRLLPQLERSLHPDRFGPILRAVADRHRVPLELLQGLAKQESRFTPTVQSGAGAVGLMQLMPATASELAGAPVSTGELEDPARNADLGGRYLQGLLGRWQGNLLLAVASYNAGPAAVEGWIDPRLTAAPELWVEAIPYPETRLYVKRVLGNAWSYRNPGWPGC